MAAARPRRRRLLRQGPYQGGPVRRLCIWVSTPGGVAKNIVAAGLASRCQVQRAYADMVLPSPVIIVPVYLVETFGTGKVDDAKLEVPMML